LLLHGQEAAREVLSLADAAVIGEDRFIAEDRAAFDNHRAAYVTAFADDRAANDRARPYA
jgi:hypothetical protein